MRSVYLFQHVHPSPPISGNHVYDKASPNDNASATAKAKATPSGKVVPLDPNELPDNDKDLGIFDFPHDSTGETGGMDGASGGQEGADESKSGGHEFALTAETSPSK